VECLRDFIGILGCGNPIPESGLFINSLPGISLESIQKIANSEQKTYVGVWNDVQTRALRILQQRVQEEFKKRYRLKTIRESFKIPQVVDAVNNQTAAANKLRGFLTTTSNLRGNLQMLSLERLFLYLKASPPGDVVIKIYDNETHVLLDTFTILQASALVGWNTVQVNRAYPVSQAFVGFNSTAIDCVYLSLDATVSEGFCHCIQKLCGCDDCEGTLTGASADANSDNLETGKNTFGLSAVFSIVCRFDGLVCDNKNTFATPLWWLLGAELMVERLYGGARINKWTLDEKTAGELKSYYQAEFEKSLESAIEGIDLDLSDCCLECNEPIISVERLP
jgi:hypothetical protein